MSRRVGKPAPLHDPARLVLDGIRRIVRVLRESSRAAEERVGLSGAQLFVLQTLADGGSLSVKELAARTLTHQSSVSVVVGRLVARGLVARATSPLDGRRLALALAPRGRALLTRAPHAAQERLIEGVRRLSPHAQRRLATSLEGLVAAMGLGAEVPGMLFEPDPRPPRRRAPR